MSPDGTTPYGTPGVIPTPDILTSVFHQYGHPVLDRVMGDPAAFRAKIVYVRIDRDENGAPSFCCHELGGDPAAYFYPASTVKLPLALSALEKIHALRLPALTIDTPFYASSGEPGSQTVPTTLRRCIRDIFLVSDNQSANRLYEFVGPVALHASLRSKGYVHTEIRHRFGLAPSEARPGTGPVRFVERGVEIYAQAACPGAVAAGDSHPADGIPLHGFPEDGTGNRTCLKELLEMLRSVLFPQSLPARRRFRLKAEDLAILQEVLQAYPSDQVSPRYDPHRYPPAYGKFLLWGGARDARIPPYLKVFNKAGWAYGFLTDVAYVADYRHQVEFMLGATLRVDSCAATGGDAGYDYDRIGKPFLGALGQAVYAYELSRPRKYLPNLTRYSPSWEQLKPLKPGGPFQHIDS